MWKASYIHVLACKYHFGILSDSTIISMDDKSLVFMLTMVKGIDGWSIHMFMIFSSHSLDVLPVGDLVGAYMLYVLEDVLVPSQSEQLCQQLRSYLLIGA
ncbi:hypothetical protein IEQ34_003182 [Dendrobium chrysotoxum]|uniref:Uncharacterized protein n=1 Tax=Dendrobium chrysotoxum TaxID=161865 RepID=A0AAV7H2Y0_DENCH|nr:hypothetical protein IEQ34_003182 [Dendrobium chrysotoxum]